VCWGVLASLTGSSTVGLQLFRTLCYFGLAGMYVFPVLTASFGLTRERQARTLGLLRLTDMSNSQLVMGKLFSSLFAMLFTALSMFPMLVLSASLGGIAARQIALGLLVLLGVIFLGCCLGLFSAATAKTERSANVRAGIACVSMALVAGLGSTASGLWPEIPILRAISPFNVVSSLTRGEYLHHAGINFLAHVLVGMIFLVVAALLLSGSIVKEDRPSVAEGIRQKFKRMRIAGRSTEGKTIVTGNPMEWKDVNVTFGGIRLEIAATLLVALLATGIALAACLLEGMSFDEEVLRACALTVFAATGLVFVLACVVRSCRGFNTEKAGGGLEILLTTPMTDREIVRGKCVAVFRSSMPWLICSLAAGTGALLLEWNFVDVNVGTAIMLTIVVCLVLLEVFWICCMALWLSIRYKAAAALGICLGVFCICIIPLFGIPLHVILGVFFVHNLFTGFRARALRYACAE
jgi:ABC-type Na+ efflux pump permease subunit